MAVTTQTFTVYSQSYTNSQGVLTFAPKRTWRAYFDAMAAANIGWTKTVNTDTLTTNDGGEYSCTMTHTLSGMYFSFSTNNVDASTDYVQLAFYYSNGFYRNYGIRAYRPSGINGQNTYYVDSIGSYIQEARIGQGVSTRLWTIVLADQISGSTIPIQVEMSGTDTTIAGPNNHFFFGNDKWAYADETNQLEVMWQSRGYFTVKATGQYVIRRWYGYFSGMTDGVIVTLGGKKLWYTENYTFVPKAVYLINQARYIAINEYLIIEE